MKKVILIFSILLITVPLNHAREAQISNNDITSIESYFKENIKDLDPIEGVYQISIKFYYKDDLIYKIKPFHFFVDEYGEKEKRTFVLCFVGNFNPLTGENDDFNKEDGFVDFHMFGLIYNYPVNTNSYIFQWVEGAKEEDISNIFVLDVGKNDFYVELKLSGENYDYWGFPQKYKNKKLKMVIQTKKVYPLR